MADRSRSSTAEKFEVPDELRPRSNPVQERSKETVNRILESAAELVDEVGVVGFTTNLLAERSGVRIRTIYRYFPGKLGILSALIVHLNADSEVRLGHFNELGNPECDWRELVERWVEELVQWLIERPGAHLLMGWSHGVPELMELQDRIDADWARSMMEAMRARGVDLPRKHLYAVCCTFNDTMDAMAELVVSEDRSYREHLTEEMQTILVRYLEAYLD